MDRTWSITDLCKIAHHSARAHGFYDVPTTIEHRIALIHSELSEAVEDARMNNIHCNIIDGKPTGLAVELADAVIRIADLAESLGIDLQTTIEIKHRYNQSRPYKHGKVSI
jgi:NTP pyrophosphatase (non-canonical NTP hydrolase)